MSRVAFPVLAELSRMEASRRQTHAHLAIIERQIAVRAARLASAPARSAGPASSARQERLFREHCTALTFARHFEIAALSRKLSRQDRALAALRRHYGLDAGVYGAAA